MNIAAVPTFYIIQVWYFQSLVHSAIYGALSMCQVMKSPDSTKMNGA